MKNILMRPTSALFPAVLLFSMLLGERIMTANLYVFWLMMQLFSLCSVDAFRNAAAREPGVRKVDKRFSGAWLTILAGGAITVIVEYFWHEKSLSGDLMLPAAAAWLIIIEQLFEERMFALSRRTDGVVLSIIANVLLLVGLLLDGSGGVPAPVEMAGFYTACGAGLGALISIAANYVIEPMHAFSLVPRNIAFAPKAAVQCLLYPVVMMLTFGVAEAAAAGLILWRLSRTVCRRSQDESRPLNLMLITVSAVLAVCSLFIPVMPLANAAAAAMLCAAIVFCAPGWRFYCGVVLVTAANAQLYFSTYMPPQWNVLPVDWNVPVVCICCVIAVILNLHKAFLRKV